MLPRAIRKAIGDGGDEIVVSSVPGRRFIGDGLNNTFLLLLAVIYPGSQVLPISGHIKKG